MSGAGGNVFVVSGPSGVGKGTIVEQVVARLDRVWVSVSATTRDPRPGDVEGKTYRFVTDARFDELIANDGLLEWANVHAHRYGTPRDAVEAHVRDGWDVILEIDVQGALQVRDTYPAAKLVFIEPPSLAVLEQRLRGRNTEAEDVIAARMRVAEVELSFKDRYDYRVVNDELERAVDEVIAYMRPRP